MASTPDSTETNDSTSIITTLHPDIIHSHILTRLDAATLATAASASSQLRRLCTEENLWRNICIATWPSLKDPLASHVISTFPSSHRSIFSDSFPSLHHLSSQPNHLHRPSPLPQVLISAVDMHYQGKPVFSRVQRTSTQKNWFLSSPLFLELLEPNELVPTPVKMVRKNEHWFKHLEENLSLSWILIDPTRKRAFNLSSRWPVLVQRHWLTRDLEVVYAVVMAGEHQRSTEVVRCVVKVTCCGKVGEELHVGEVNMVMEDMEGRHVTGKEGVVILQRAMENGERKRVDGVGAKVRFEGFTSMMKERRESRHRTQKAWAVAFAVVVFTALTLFCWFTRF